jgi:hypothetical protein
VRLALERVPTGVANRATRRPAPSGTPGVALGVQRRVLCVLLLHAERGLRRADREKVEPSSGASGRLTCWGWQD